MEDRSMVRHHREEFETGRAPQWPPRKKSAAPTGWATGFRLHATFTLARALLYLAQLLSNLAARLLQRRLLPLVFIRWVLRISYAFTRLSFCVLRARMRRGRSD